MSSSLTSTETYIFAITLYIITLLALIGGIHLTYNICGCNKKCHKYLFKCFHSRNLNRHTNKSVLNHSQYKPHATPIPTTDSHDFKNTKNNHRHQKLQKQRSNMDNDYHNDTDTEHESYALQLCKIVCVSTVTFFLVFLFVGCYQFTLANNDFYGFGLFKYHSIEQCRILFCMIGFYVYGKMLLYAYFVIRAYNMLEGSMLNYNKSTVAMILSIYFVMMNFILFSMIYVHLTDDYCNAIHSTHIHQKRSIVFGIDAAVDGSMAILSVSLLIHKLFALVRQSVNVHGGLSKITPRTSPMNTPRQSVISQTQSVTNNNSVINNINRTRSVSETIPSKKHFKTAQKNNIKKYEIQYRVSKQIEMNMNRPKNVMNNFRRCSKSKEMDSDNDSTNSINNPHTHALQSVPSSTRQSRLTDKRASVSITPIPILINIECSNDVFSAKEIELQSIYSNEQLMSSQTLKETETINENAAFEVMEEDDINDKAVTPLNDTVLSLPKYQMHNSVSKSRSYNEEDSMDEEEKSPLQTVNSVSQKNNLQIPQINSNSMQSMSDSQETHTHTRELSKSVTKSRSPRNSILSLSRRNSSIFRASEIVSKISAEHIRKFHSVTQYDNEILLLSTKLLILLTVCVISSFCSFLLLFGIIRTDHNNGIFFVYGIDSFINIWCLAFTFKFSNKCYNILFNCGNSNRCTKLCFPMVKTAALTWKCCCCNQRKEHRLNIRQYRPNMNKKHKNGHHRVSQNSVTYNYQLSNTSVTNNMHKIDENMKKSGGESNEIDLDDLDMDEIKRENESEESQCHMNCCFCCCGNDQEIQIYHMATKEVELMVNKNSKLYK